MTRPVRTFTLPGAGLQCAHCSAVLPTVYRTITTEGFVTRERICPKCGKKNITSERVIHVRDSRKYFSS